MFTDITETERVAASYFLELFRSSNPIMQERVLDGHINQISFEEKQFLEFRFTRMEIKEAFFQIGVTKSLGPGGMLALFFQKYWNIVEDEVVETALKFLNGGLLDLELNKTYVVLIPKVTNAECMTQFRPMSLCNVIYKIMNKYLANRLKTVLLYLISDSQSAFV